MQTDLRERRLGIMKRILLALMVAAILAALLATTADAQMSWYWCQDYYGYWMYCYY